MRKQRKGGDASVLMIDRTRLDDEWLKQPELMFKYSHLLAEAKEQLDIAKSECEIVRAELDLEVRQSPEDFGFEKGKKPSEAAINSVLLNDEGVQASMASIISAKHLVDLNQAMVTSLDHRKKALENLVFLHGQSYFATPRAKDASSAEEINERRQKKALQPMEKRRTRRRKEE